MEISLITITGDRPEAFRLCEKYMARQTIQGFEWIVVDDGTVPTEVTRGQKHLPLPAAETPMESFRRNLNVAFEMATGDKILFVEDDDCYHDRHYVEVMKTYLDRYDLVGQARARYYNVKHRQYKIHANQAHASLCQTGIRRGPTLKTLQNFVRSNRRPDTADSSIWRRCGVPEPKKHLMPMSSMVLAVKGVPGRQGLGIHHSAEELTKAAYAHDPDGALLKHWLGEEDAAPYLGWYEQEQQA